MLERRHDLNFLDLTFENFMCFRQRQHLRLRDVGLVLIQGNNQISGAADSNGAGKSAVVDAISWVLFGQTLRGLRGDDVACRFTKDICEVELKFQVNGKVKEITRCRRPQGLHLSWIKEDLSVAEKQAHIEQLLGFGFRTFSNAVVFGQGALERFAMASNEDQLKMVDEIQGLDLRQALQRAKEYRDEWERKHWELEQGRWGLKQQEEGAKSQIKELEEARKEFAANQASRIKEGERGHQGIVDEVKQLRSELAKVKGREQWLRSAQKIVREIYLAKEKAEELKKVFDLSKWEWQAGFRRLEAETDSIKELSKQKRCPTCRQAVSLGKLQIDFESHVKDIKDEIAVMDKKANRAMGKWKAQVDCVRDLQEMNPDVTSEKVAAAEVEVFNIKDLQARMTSAQTRLRVSEGILTRERAFTWEGDGLLKATKKDLKQLFDKMVVNNNQQIKAANTLRVAEYWVEAFGDRGLRSLLFDSVGGFLNERLTEHLEILTAGEANVQVSALSQTKGGKIKDRISVGAEWSWGANTYAAGSAGQDRRIDIALYCALQDLAEMRSARGFPLRVFDEAIDSIDARGREMFANWLHREARKRSATFVITHSQEFGDLLNPDQVWTVVMDRGGSRVEVG